MEDGYNCQFLTEEGDEGGNINANADYSGEGLTRFILKPEGKHVYEVKRIVATVQAASLSTGIALVLEHSESHHVLTNLLGGITAKTIFDWLAAGFEMTLVEGSPDTYQFIKVLTDPLIIRGTDNNQLAAICNDDLQSTSNYISIDFRKRTF